MRFFRCMAPPLTKVSVAGKSQRDSGLADQQQSQPGSPAGGRLPCMHRCLHDLQQRSGFTPAFMLDADRPRRQTQEPDSPPPIAGRSLQPVQFTPDSATSHAASEALSGAESLEDRRSGPNAGSDTPKAVLSMLSGHPIRAYSNLGPGRADVNVVPQPQEPPPAEAPGSAEAQQEAGLIIGQLQLQATTAAAEAGQPAPAHAESAVSPWASVEDVGKAAAASGGHDGAEVREGPAVETEGIAPDASEMPNAAAAASAAQELADQEQEGHEMLHEEQPNGRQPAEAKKDMQIDEVGCSK